MTLEFVDIVQKEDENGFTGEYEYVAETNMPRIEQPSIEFMARTVTTSTGQQTDLAGTFTSGLKVPKGQLFKFDDMFYRIAQADRTPVGFFRYGFVEVDDDIS